MDFIFFVFVCFLPQSLSKIKNINVFVYMYVYLVPSPSPRIMSPMGFAINRQARHVATVMDDTSLYDDDWDRSSGDGPPSSFIRPVPIWLCVFLGKLTNYYLFNLKKYIIFIIFLFLLLTINTCSCQLHYRGSISIFQMGKMEFPRLGIFLFHYIK